MTDELMREVDDDIRRERLQRLWVQYRTPFLLVVGLLVVGLIGLNFWTSHQRAQAGEAMLALDRATTLLQKGKADGAIAQLHALEPNSTRERHDLVLWWLGRAYDQAGQTDAAVKQWHALASHPQGSDLLWRDLACLRLLQDGATVPENCASDGASPLRAQRREAVAAQRWQQGDVNDARRMLQAVADDANAPSGQRSRAARLLAAMGEK